MKKFVQILYGKAHWIFEAETKPEFSDEIVLIDITDDTTGIVEGWDYDSDTGLLTEPVPWVPPVDDTPTQQDVSEEILLETKYQTALLETLV